MKPISSGNEPMSMKNHLRFFNASAQWHRCPYTAKYNTYALSCPFLALCSHPLYFIFVFFLALMQKKPKSYSAALMDQIPIKYLVTQAQGLQQELGGVTFVQHTNHLCLE